MGYNFQVSDKKFCIKPENKKAALEAVKALGLGENEGNKYGWADSAYFKDAKTLRDAVSEWGWTLDETDEEEGKISEVIDIYFHSEKLGSDDVLFDALGPYVEKGSFISCVGEDGCMWRWYFDGERMIDQTPEIEWK